MPTRLSQFVPALVKRRFQNRAEPLKRSESERFPGVMMLADVTGSTLLAEQLLELSQHGPEASELFMERLNTCFSIAIACIEQQGGDIVKFAGDGLLVLWPSDERGLRLSLQRAAQCGLEIQRALARHAEETGLRLHMRVCICAGDLLVAHLGGVYDRWELLVTGAPMIQLSRCLSVGKPGKVTLSQEAYLLLSPKAVAQPLEPAEAQAVELLEVQSPPPSLLPQGNTSILEERALRAYIPAALVNQLRDLEPAWTVERRKVTTLFVHLPGLESLAAYRLDEAQEIVQTAQHCIYEEEGTLLRLNADDKGVMLLVAFGLPPLSHEDDATRAVRTALRLVYTLSKLGQPCSIGVTTGAPVCGIVGTPQRSEYALVGETVHLAARLCLASEHILCDQETMREARALIAFESLAPIVLKGRRQREAVFSPLGISSQVRSASSPGLEVRTSRDQISLDAMLMSRLDRLPATGLLLLKVCSQLPEPFMLGQASALFPQTPSEGGLEALWALLLQRGWLQGDPLSFSVRFSDPRVRRICAQLLTEQQRRQLLPPARTSYSLEPLP